MLLPRGCGAVFSFSIRGTRAQGRKFIEALSLFSHLANVGDAKSLVIHPASTTHFRMSAEALVRPGLVPFCGPYQPWAPVPFTRPWQARKPFLAARSELPQLWEKTALRGSLKHSLRLYKKMLKLRFKKKAPIDKERRFFLDYLSNTRFADRAEHF